MEVKHELKHFIFENGAYGGRAIPSMYINRIIEEVGRLPKDHPDGSPAGQLYKRMVELRVSMALSFTTATDAASPNRELAG